MEANAKAFISTEIAIQTSELRDLLAAQTKALRDMLRSEVKSAKLETTAQVNSKISTLRATLEARMNAESRVGGIAAEKKMRRDFRRILENRRYALRCEVFKKIDRKVDDLKKLGIKQLGLINTGLGLMEGRLEKKSWARR